MAKLDCLRCGAKMDGPQREKIQLGEQGFLGGEWAHLMAGALVVDLYHCPKCGKLEFFAPGHAQAEDPDALPQKECPGCGLSIDFDYPKCPCCGHDFYRK
ncbi:MAG: hypothetical protein IJZ39_02075 [Oscillospiraceae bacterium]|nr:hypothetical protein [Oscillospiraceae bacterium]